MNRLARLCMQGRRFVSSPTVAAFLAAALIVRCLGPRCLRMGAAGLHLILLCLWALQNTMFATVAFAASVDILSCVEVLAWLHVFRFDLTIAGFLLIISSCPLSISVAIIGYISTGRGEMTAGVPTAFSIT